MVSFICYDNFSHSIFFLLMICYTIAPLLPLYIFEAKTSILLRLARDPKGADLLCNHRIVEVLSECQYMKVQRQDFVEAGDEATKELNNRYHRLIMPTLQLMTTLLCTYQGQNDEVLLNVRKKKA